MENVFIPIILLLLGIIVGGIIAIRVLRPANTTYGSWPGYRNYPANEPISQESNVLVGLLLGVGLVLAFLFGKPAWSSYNPNKFPPKVATDSVQKQAITAHPTPDQPDTSSPVLSPTPIEPPDEVAFFVQVGVFKELSNALELQQKWAEKSTTPCFLVGNTDALQPLTDHWIDPSELNAEMTENTRVVLGPFETEAAARAFAKRGRLEELVWARRYFQRP